MSKLHVENIQVAYSSKLIIEDLSIVIPAGKVTTIIGPNGCGKSTLLKAVGRILDIKKGCITLDCKDIHELSTKDIAKKMAILPQSPIAPEGITVEELISYGRFPYQKGIGKLTKEDKRIIDWSLEATNLKDFAYTSVDCLSGGQRQRVWIAMALAQQTDIILLDEPTTYLDMSYQLEVLELLDELNKEQGCTIVMVLHDINLAAKFADYMIALKDGKVIKAGRPKDIMTKEVLKEVFNIEANIVIDASCNQPVCMSYQLVDKRKGKIDKIQRGA